VVSILGREAELEQIREVLASSIRGRAARAIRIVGPSGIGKTALAESALSAAAPTWLVATVGSHHIQSSLPLFAARRAAQALLAQLGPDAERYSSGLRLEREQPDVFEESFFRVLEGISLDHPILLAFDDAQWADRESRALIERSVRALADRSIVLLSTERSEDAAAFDFRDEAIALHELSDADSLAIARNIYPEANNDVLAAISERAAGRAVDLIALSEGARDQSALTARDVDTSLRRTISRDLTLIDASLREFLQVCSLIDDPIEYTLLCALWPEEFVLSQVTAAAKFLVQRKDGLYFVHDAIKQSVRETIAIAIPFHRRIIAAIRALPSLRLEDYERLAEQAAACGDRDLQRATLLTLGEEAHKGEIYSLAVSAWERAIDLAQPNAQDLIPFYSRLSLLYNMLSRERDNIRICRYALEFARNAGITTGIAQLVTSLSFALFFSGNYNAAKAELARYEDVLTSQTDRAQLYSSTIYVAIASGDSKGAEEAQAAYSLVEAYAEPIVRVRVNTHSAIMASREGDSEAALRLIGAAEESAQAIPVARVMPLVAATSHAFHYQGPRGIEPYLTSPRKDEAGADVLDLLRLLTHVARGEFIDAGTLGAELTVRQRGFIFRRLSLGLRSSAEALRDPNSGDAVWQEILGDVAAFQTGDESSTLIPIATAWVLRESKSNPRRAKALLERLLDRSGSAGQFMVFHFPVLLAVAARNVDDTLALERISTENGLRATREPWSQAQRMLARGVASAFLHKSDAGALLTDARDRFKALDSPFFASLGERYSEYAAPASNSDGRFGATTRREREIAGLVAEGLTNRDIAERLVLSERTIEGHIANLFNKLEVSSRTQVAAWYLRATNSVA
jgi:DNA-binding CsgD family transcriptional regulator